MDLEKYFIKRYQQKIKAILSDRLELHGNNDKHISDVKTWLCCEWQCGMIEDIETYNILLKKVDLIAKNMIKAL